MSENEQEKRETSADIADEIRRAVESMGDEMPYTVSAGTMRRVADRINASAKREKAAIEADALARNCDVYANLHDAWIAWQGDCALNMQKRQKFHVWLYAKAESGGRRHEMTWAEFKSEYHFREIDEEDWETVDKCCDNCEHWYGDCCHPKLIKRERKPIHSINVCDAWEKEVESK